VGPGPSPKSQQTRCPSWLLSPIHTSHRRLVQSSNQVPKLCAPSLGFSVHCSNSCWCTEHDAFAAASSEAFDLGDCVQHGSLSTKTSTQLNWEKLSNVLFGFSRKRTACAYNSNQLIVPEREGERERERERERESVCVCVCSCACV